MTDPDPTAETAHECLGVPPDASHEEVKLAAAHAKSQFNPDHHPEPEKRAVRDRFHAVRAAEEALLSDGEFPPPRLRLDRETGDDVDDGDNEADGHDDEADDTDDERPTLSVLPRSETVVVGEPVVVEVREATGDRLDHGEVVVGDAAASVAHGRATVTVTEPGSKTVVARADGRVARTTVTVVPETVALCLDCSATRVAVGDSLEVAVRRQSDGGLVRGATVHTDRGETHDATHGTVTLGPTRPGELRVTATDDASDRSYEPATTVVTVEPAGDALSVEAPATVRPDTSFGVIVRDTAGRPVEAARVAVRRGEESLVADTTDGAGRTRLSVPVPGSYTLRATASEPGVDPAERTLTVAPERTTLALSVVDRPTARKPVGRVVVRDEWGRPVAGATVTAAGEETATDDRGRAAIRLPPGEHVVTARKAGGFESGELRVTVDRERSS